MILTNLNFLLLLSLLIINGIFVLSSKRKRRFGIIPSRIFQIIFISYWVYLLIFLQISDNVINATPEVSKSRKKQPVDFNWQIQKKMEMEKTAKIHVEYLNYLIKASGIQALIVTCLCVFGLLSVNNRNEYYWRAIIIHSVCFGFCIYIDFTNIVI